MWNLLKSIWSAFGSTEEESLSKEAEEDLIRTASLSDPTDLCVSEDNDNYFTGTVTHTNNEVAVIDHTYYFHFKDSLSSQLLVGDYVKFILNENENIVKRVQKATRLDSELKEIPKIDSNNECDTNEISIINLTGIVTKRIARDVFVRTEEDAFQEISFSLDRVSAEFIPMEGDIIILEGLIGQEKKNNLTVKKISPKATSVKMGTVTLWDISNGIISNFAIFNLESCEPGYDPAEGDKVLASLIHIYNAKGYKWRAVKVVIRFQNVNYISNDLREARMDLTTNKYGINIPVLSKFVLKIDTSIEFNVEVKNLSSVDTELINVYPWPTIHNSQISLVSPVDKCCVIMQNKKFNFTFKIESKFIGYSSIEYVWDFGGFKISRMFELEVISTQLNEIMSVQPSEKLFHFKREVSAMKLLNQSSGDIMPGQKINSRCPIYPVQLDNFTLPKKILVAALPDNRLNFDDLLIRVEEVLPCLREELSPETYCARFTGLLYLEEVEQLKQMGELGIERAHFKTVGDYLVLEVPPFSAYGNRLITGDKVIATLPWNEENVKFEGIVHRVKQTEIWIKFSKHFHYNYQPGTDYSLSFIKSRNILRRMHQAVNLAWKFLGSEFLFPTEVQMSSQKTFDKFSKNEISPKKTKRTHIFKWNNYGAGYGTKTSIDNVVDVKISKDNIENIQWFNKKLNNEQKCAVTNILKGEARPLPYIIFGPPGTGKSMTVVESILQVYSLFTNSRILVATPSNSAADLLAERLIDMGVIDQKYILRVVGLSALEQGRIAASLIPYAAVLDFKEYEDDNCIQMIGREAVKNYRIIIGTVGSVNSLFNMGFPRGHYTHIFIDEAGQVTEPEILSVLILINAANGQVIMAGDPFQLGPVVYSKVAIKYGLQESLLFRFLDRFPYKRDSDGFPDSYGYDPRLVTKLVNNYRSIPAILKLSNMLFYDNDLIANVSENSGEEGSVLRLLGPLFQVQSSEGSAPPLIFHGVRGTNCQEKKSHSWYNPQEAYQVFFYLNTLYEAGVSPDYVGIITPYQLQAVKIRRMLEQLNIEPPKIGSVEEFQGQEKMIIILTVVRSSLEYISYDTQRALGFIRNPRRLNVALSRARAMLIIIGNPHLLCFDKQWKKILKYCISNNYYTGCNLPAKSI